MPVTRRAVSASPTSGASSTVIAGLSATSSEALVALVRCSAAMNAHW